MFRHLLNRSAIIAATSIAIAVGLLFAIPIFQDWSATYQGWFAGEPSDNLMMTPPLGPFNLAPPLGPDNPPSPESFSPTVAVPPMPVVTGIKIVSADEIHGEIADDDLVLGVEIDGKSRAYSINMMTGPSREIFNDTLAGRPIAATW